MAEESLRSLSRIDRLLSPYDPKQMKMISTLWRSRGLLGKWKTDEAFFDYVKNVMNSAAARKGGYASLGKALDHIFGKGNYKGLPLDYDKTGSSTKGNRKVTKVFWNKRKVQQTIPLSIRDRVARMEKDGTFEKAGIEPGILDRIETRNKKGLTRLQKETRRLEKLYGIKFEMGHLTAIANLGTDNPLNLFPELKSENRSHNKHADPIDPKTQRALGWGGGHEEDLYEMILEEGGNPSVLGVKSTDWTSADQGKMARMGGDLNQVGFKRRDAILDRTLQNLEQNLAKADKEGGLLKFVDDINARITDGGYQSIAPTLKPQPKGKILNVVSDATKGLSKTPARFLLPGALATAGLTLGGMNVQAKTRDFEEDPTLINRIQKHAAQAELGLEGADIATGGFAALPTTAAQLGLFALDQGLEYIERGGKKDKDANMSLLGDLPKTNRRGRRILPANLDFL